VAEGDAQACRQLVDELLPAIAGFSYRMLGDGGAAEDVAQEAFLRLWRQAPKWRAEARVTTWLHRVAYNLCIDRIRARREVPVAEVPEVADPADGPLIHRHRREVSELVEAAIAGLPERQRVAITLVHYQELGNLGSAAVMEISVEALESLLARGRRALRDALSEQRKDLLGDLR
jgi:RNA polymerase sigma-70 factor (ECF subfamily)